MHVIYIDLNINVEIFTTLCCLLETFEVYQKLAYLLHYCIKTIVNNMNQMIENAQTSYALPTGQMPSFKGRKILGKEGFYSGRSAGNEGEKGVDCNQEVGHCFYHCPQNKATKESRTEEELKTKKPKPTAGLVPNLV